MNLHIRSRLQTFGRGLYERLTHRHAVDPRTPEQIDDAVTLRMAGGDDDELPADQRITQPRPIVSGK